MTVNIRKVLIVDDEYFIGKLIYKLVDWDSKSLECADILDNGEDAIDYIKSNTPDIVITDIRMPGISGLDLIRETRDISNKIQWGGFQHLYTPLSIFLCLIKYILYLM